MCQVPEGDAASIGAAAEYEGPVVHGACIAICGPVEDENHSNGPDLPEQGPTGWRADAHEHLEVGCAEVFAALCIVCLR